MTMRAKLLVASGTACLALLIFAAVSMSDDGVTPSFLPKEGEVVAIYSKQTGKYLEVSPSDGRLRATADAPKTKGALPPPTALFRVMLLSTQMKDVLVDSMRTANSATWSKRRHWTGVPPGSNSTESPGCKCTGFSNDHGFGAYCFGWEYDSQVRPTHRS